MTGFEPAASSSRTKSPTSLAILGSPRENLLDTQTEKGYPTRFAPLWTARVSSPSRSQRVSLSPTKTDRGGYGADDLLVAPVASTTDRAAEKRNSGALA